VTPVLISISNASSKVTDAEVQAAIVAVATQLATDVAPVWGQVPALEFVPAGQVGAGCPCTISDTPDQPGVLGYHDEGPDGRPYIKVFVVDGYDWVPTFSHEVLELAGNPAANLWADAPCGSDYARELCDAVEDDTYDINGLNVSNFLYPAAFDPKALPGEKFDHLGNLKAPFTMTEGGYEIRRTEMGATSQVYGASVVGTTQVHIGDGVHVVFGPRFPSERIPATLKKAERFKRGPRSGAS
jgi:hypothetical protein